MNKEVRMMKALIAHSGEQAGSRVRFTEEAIRKMHEDSNEGKRLTRKLEPGRYIPCGYLMKTELFRNEETGNLELWGYFMYEFNGVDYSKTGACSYIVNYDSRKVSDGECSDCSLVGCCMVMEGQYGNEI